MTSRAATGSGQADAKKELELMHSIYDGLKEQPAEVQQRVLTWVLGALAVPGIAPPPDGKRQLGRQHTDGKHNALNTSKYETFADLYDAADPKSGVDMALVGGYWFQECQGAEDFVAAAVNKELKMAGAKVANITVAFNGLIEASPRLVLQVRKSGKSQQARKRYKLTGAGIKAVNIMIEGGKGE